MVYITGDCHGDFTRFSTKKFPDQKEMTYQDTMIVLGDFGIWHDTPEERYWLDWLNDKPFTTVFVDGNHENFDRLYGSEFPAYSFHGGSAHEIRRHIYHLNRGYVYEFDGKTFWAFGGAKSHDISGGIVDRKHYASDEAFRIVIKAFREHGLWFRVNHESWWEQELPNEQEMEKGRAILKGYDNKVDYIVTHCCPQEISTLMGFKDADVETMYFNEIAHSVQYDHWYFGHYHKEEDVFGRFHCRYERIERIV